MFYTDYRQLDESFIGSATEMLHKFVNQTDIDTLTTDFIPKGLKQFKFPPCFSIYLIV